MGPVLGIESSCDETAAAVLDASGRVLAEQVASQEAHAPYGGVVPEIAARAHLAVLPRMVGAVMSRAGVGFSDLAGVAASGGPGLIGGVIVGSQFATGWGWAGPAARRWRSWRRMVTRRATTSPAPCSAAPAAISAFPA